jgi:hypothetical protein
MAGTFYFFSAGPSAHDGMGYVTELKQIATPFYGLRRLPDDHPECHNGLHLVTPDTN